MEESRGADVQGTKPRMLCTHLRPLLLSYSPRPTLLFLMHTSCYLADFENRDIETDQGPTSLGTGHTLNHR